MQPQRLLKTASNAGGTSRQALRTATVLLSRFMGLCIGLIMTGCVASIQGVSGPVAWEATDFRVVERAAAGAVRDIYAFTLVLQETYGTEITLTHMQQTVSQPGVHTTGVTRQLPIHWKLRPRGELRQPFSFYWYCADTQCRNWVSVAPWYNLVFTGTDQRGQPVHIAMDFRLPTNPARPKPGPPGESPTTPQPEAASTPLLRDSGAVPFQTAGKRILVHAMLNRTEYVTLLLDTGATHTFVTPATARRLGISPKTDAPKRTTTVVGGRKVEFPVVELAAITVGDTVVENLQVGVLESFPDTPLMDGLLGGNFLRHFTMMLDYATSRLQLIPKESTPAQPATSESEAVAVRSSVPIQLVGNHVLVRALLNHQESATLILDTGATYTLLTPKTAQRLGISPTEAAPRRMMQVADGEKQETPFVPLAALAVGAAVVEQLHVGVSDVFPQSHAVDGLLGGDFLENFALTLDRTARRLQLTSRQAVRP